MPILTDSRPLVDRLLCEFERCPGRSPRATALYSAYLRRRATLAAWDRAVAAWRSGEGYGPAVYNLPASMATPAIVSTGGRA